MKFPAKWIAITLLLLSSLVLAQCAPAAPSPEAPPPEPPATTAPIPTAEPTSAPAPTLAPPPPTVEPTAEVVITQGWSSTASTRTELSFGHPGNWVGPAQLPFGDGIYVKDPDKDVGMIIIWGLTGDPNVMLNAWGQEPIEIIALLEFAPETVEDGEVLTLARIDSPTKIGQGAGLTARAAYIQRPQDVMQLMFYTPTDEWEAWQDTFEEIVESIEVWRTITGSGVQTMILHDWPDPADPWEGEGTWYRSGDESMGMVIIIGPIGDPVQLTADWSTDRLAGLGFTSCTMAEGDRMRGLQGEWESKTGECSGPAGSDVTYEIAFMANRDRVLEMILYAPSTIWEFADQVFDTMLGMFSDIR